MLDGLITSLGDFMAANSGLAVVLLFLFAAGESMFVVGAFVPGTVVIVGAGALVGAGKLPFAEVYAAVALGGFVGNLASYWFGRYHRDKLRSINPFPRYHQMLTLGEGFFRRNGAAGLLASHFVPGVKAVVPALAGAMGMGAPTFAAVTLVAAGVWAAALLLPSIGLGIGLSGVAAANPRLLALGVLLLLLLWLAYRLARFIAGTVWPRAVERARRLSDHVTSRGWPGASILDAVAYNRRGIITPIFWVAAAGFAVAGFVDVTFNLANGTLTASDQAISNFVQAFRTPPADQVIVAITMLGDGVVLAAATAAMVAALLIHREYRIAGAAAAAVLATAVFVPFLKEFLQRARPQLLYEGADAFSFPSGHASMSMAVLGVAAVLISHRMRQRYRLTIYAAAATVAVLIAFSRIYLAAHWPSDVVAGLLFGAAVVSAFALVVHRRALRIRAAALGAAFGTAFVLAYGINLGSGHARWMTEYAIQRVPEPLASADWLAGGWRDLPQRRIEFNGETGERLSIQTDLAAADLEAAYAAAGWTVVPTGAGLALIGALPSGAALDLRAPLPLFHDGRQAMVAAVLSDDDPDRRLVVRFWPSGWSADGDRPILVGSVTEERLGDLPLGYAVVEDGPAAAEGIAAAEAPLRALSGAVALDPGDPSGPMILTGGEPDHPAETTSDGDPRP